MDDLIERYFEDETRECHSIRNAPLVAATLAILSAGGGWYLYLPTTFLLAFGGLGILLAPLFAQMSKERESLYMAPIMLILIVVWPRIEALHDVHGNGLLYTSTILSAVYAGTCVVFTAFRSLLLKYIGCQQEDESS